MIAFSRWLTMALATAATLSTTSPASSRPSDQNREQPNVIFIVLDDVGFADLGAYGSEIATPHMDALASAGLRYNDFHSWAICSTTRAALLTGRNAHAVGMRDLAGPDGGTTNSRGRLPASAATIAQHLKAASYVTFAAGKWHLVPRTEMEDDSPRTHWPLGKGFDRFYGFLSGWTDQFHPALVEDNERTVTPNRADYHFSEDVTDKAVAYTKSAGARPFFLYLAYGVAHAPIQVPPSYIDKYKTAYDVGWDVIRDRRFARQKELGIIPRDTILPVRNEGDGPWNQLTDDQRRAFARYMAVYAGFLEHADQQIGRLVAHLKSAGLFENTLLVLLSDNGAAGEAGHDGAFTFPYGAPTPVSEVLARLDDLGSDRSSALYPRPWAMAGNTPFKRHKLSVDAGGVKNPLIVTWPKRIPAGEIRTQFVNAIDIAPTVLDIVGIRPSSNVGGVAQIPMHGVSIAPTFASASAPAPRTTQYFELRGQRAILHDGWKAVARHVRGTPYEDDRWELYQVSRDFSESTNLADQFPDRLKALQDLWWAEARKYDVLPLPPR